MIRHLLLIAGATLALSACSKDSASTGSVKAYSAPVSSVTVCSGYGCIYKNTMRFSKAQERRLKRIMSRAKRSAKAERSAIRIAIARMEKMSRARIGFAADTKRSYQKRAGIRGEMDCVDETRNTTTYLNFLASRGWLKHHKVSRNYVARGLVLNGNLPHRSAVIVSKSGTSYAVDSWALGNGAKPKVMPVAKWRSAVL